MLEFWALLIGVPFIACCFIFGVALNRWEREKVDAEEGAREQERLMDLWRLWSSRHLRVATSVAVMPVPASTFGELGGDLPVNKDRSKGLGWKVDNSANERYSRVLTELASRLKKSFENRREITVELLYSETPDRIKVFSDELKAALGVTAPGVRFTMNSDASTRCAQWITDQVDRLNDVTTLVVAAQSWPDEESPGVFTEGVAALLLEPNVSRDRSRANRNAADDDTSLKANHVSRPMTTTADTLEADIAQMLEMLEMQAAPSRPTHLWHTGCDAALSSAIQSAMKADPKNPVIERSFDYVVGLPGPATSWIMLATALEVAPQGSPPQLLAWRDPVDGQLHLCTIAPAEQQNKVTQES
ncbi:hypothetical protein AWB75_04058 [Caballeronia catudaia]|uniref:Uncharacterized protein n=2 Tax=Caballeronia catudaia TaxID=1777136 RepID=A0A158BVP7_9BURK|nr:hypothetical protein AWB75_04058 [Caballeronia catudaia]